MLENIKALCAERGITIAELERACGITPRTVYRWNENTPSVTRAKLVADYLCVTVDELLRTANTT